jgi:N-acetylglucosamine kinase-like BadF-type ATPase
MGENGSTSEATYFLGFDGGGSKTECVLAAADGQILGRSTAGPSNPMRSGYTRAWFSLSEAADILLDRQKITSFDIRGICAGVGGAARTSAARRLTTFFQRSFPQADVEVTTDFEIAFEAAFGSGEGIILDAGTGSFAFGRDAAGREERAGGRGPWFSDEGSGFDIGRRAVAATLLAEENRGPATALNGQLFGFLEVRDWNSLIDHASKDPDALFPRVFPLVAQLADLGDEVSREILSSAAASLARLAVSVVEKLGWHVANREPGAATSRREIPIARIGGMHGRSQFFDSALDTALSQALPNKKYVELAVTPAEAAVRIASRANGNASSAQ